MVPECQKSIFLFLTEQCNLACAHCYVSASPSRIVRMSDKVLGDSYSLFVEKLGVKDVRLTGGEPTLHPHFSAIAETFKAGGCRVRLISNGTILYRSRLGASLLRHVDDCWISLYGTTANRHTEIAGRGALSYPETLDLVASVANTGFPLGVSL